MPTKDPFTAHCNAADRDEHKEFVEMLSATAESCGATIDDLATYFEVLRLLERIGLDERRLELLPTLLANIFDDHFSEEVIVDAFEVLVARDLDAALNAASRDVVLALFESPDDRKQAAEAAAREAEEAREAALTARRKHEFASRLVVIARDVYRKDRRELEERLEEALRLLRGEIEPDGRAVVNSVPSVGTAEEFTAARQRLAAETSDIGGLDRSPWEPVGC